MSDLLGAILEVPWAVLDYERWLADTAAHSDDYLFAESKARFEAHPEDRPRVPEDLALSDARGGVRLSSVRLGGGLVIEGVKRPVAERLLQLLDGTRTLAELRVLAGADRAALERLFARALGTLVFVPEAVAALEDRLSGVELVRFVGAPYEVVRPYWSNMADVRAHAETVLGPELTLDGFLGALRRLHVIALLGEDLQSFYRPASRITRGGARPGSFYEGKSHRVQSSVGPLLLSGPRVGVSLMGGPRYHALVYAGAGDPEASLDRSLVHAGLALGEVVTGRAVDDRASAAWFLPPRPLLPAHFEQLFQAYRQTLEGPNLAALATFHWLFVRLHPFRCANQSLAMNLVNSVLARAHGAGIPHLILDQLALRLKQDAYARVFELAVSAHSVSGPYAARWAALGERKARSYALLQRLQNATSDAEASDVVRADPDAARFALISEI